MLHYIVQVGASGTSQHLQDTAETELLEQTEFAQAIQLLPENHSALQISDLDCCPNQKPLSNFMGLWMRDPLRHFHV
jgi:hypothetical protein